MHVLNLSGLFLIAQRILFMAQSSCADESKTVFLSTAPQTRAADPCLESLKYVEPRASHLCSYNRNLFLTFGADCDDVSAALEESCVTELLLRREKPNALRAAS